MKKILFFNIIAAATLMLFTGCELTSEEYSKISSDLYPTTERDAQDMVTAAYVALGNNDYSGAFCCATGFHLLSDAATDQFVCGWGGANWYPLVTGDLNNEDGSRNPRRLWSDENRISRIGRMELAIDRIKGIAMDETLKNRYIAELECGQGFLAFLLWDLYGGIVIADLETLKKPEDEKILPRKTSDETVAYIESKLKSTFNILPKTIPYGNANYGRFTEGLVHTILLKLYMQTKQWAKAETEGRELMKPEYGYALVTDKGGRESAYANIFSDANEGNSETIWAVNELRDFSSHNWGAHVSDWWGDGYRMRREFLNTFEAGDTRNGTQLIVDDGRAMGIQPLKYEMGNADNLEAIYTDWIVYRYADVLTLLAEAIVKKNNSVTPEAIDLLNQVRTRAGLAVYAAADLPDVNTFIDKLLWERAHELWFEGCRRQDLIRNDRYRSTMVQKRLELGESGPVTPATEEQYHLFPLPSSAINEFRKGGFANQQNPGYGD
ncbi:MAG: RagB/SusD family nutrient uptake outer membrane protein [Dysgonamonadaceae bacterium]|jgi:hypothetical protein|nr:RagB/SusD family nutrient uptake outer membrane protein [Dysgonamonadaceae bacterium]